MLFRRYALEAKLVKKSKQAPVSTDAVEETNVDPEKIAEIAQEFITTTAITVGAVVIATTVVKTVCHIAVIAAKAKL